MNDSTDQGNHDSAGVAPQRAVRWRLASVILALAVSALVVAWLVCGRQRQDRNLAMVIIGIFTVLLLLLWCLFLSSLRWRIRLGVLGGAAGTVLVLTALFRFHGVTGDLLPLFEWRWQNPRWISVARQTAPPPRTVLGQANEVTTDWPQFLGPNRNNIVTQPRLARDWHAQIPRRLWLQPVGPGWSGFAVVGSRAITQEQRGDNEAVVCYDLLSGAPLWVYASPTHFQSPLAGEGPRATPTVAGQRVYALGSTGVLNCLGLESGKLVWSKDIVGENGATVNEWGMSGSPLIADELVVVSAGGKNQRSLVAYRAATGEFAWGAGTDGAGYSSPCLVNLCGVTQILIFNSGGVSAHDPMSGTNLWKYHWRGGHPHVSMPIVLPGDRLLISSGYGVGSELLQVQKDSNGIFNTRPIWKSTRLKAKFTNLIYRDGYIYGLDDGIMVCLDASNGELKWKEGRYGHGQEILVGDVLLVTAESGQVILLDPNPQESRELTRFAALQGKTWNPPALAGQYLLVRNDREAACYRLPLAQH